MSPKLNIVPFVSVDNMMRLVLHLGLDQVLIDLAAEIEADFKRWPLFDKRPRVASHSDVGVIELIPTSAGELDGVIDPVRRDDAHVVAVLVMQDRHQHVAVGVDLLCQTHQETCQVATGSKPAGKAGRLGNICAETCHCA